MRSPVRHGGAADVVVLSGGGAGLSAAIDAATAGRSVILLEKGPPLGGSTAWSVGSVSAISTPHQIRRGIKDRPNDHFEGLEALSGPLSPRDNPLLRRLLVDAVPDTFRWLMVVRCRSCRIGGRACTRCCRVRAPSSPALRRRLLNEPRPNGRMPPPFAKIINVPEPKEPFPMPRVSLIEEGDHPELAELIAKLRSGRRGALLKLYRLLLKSPAIAANWFELSNAVRWKTDLPGRLRELAIMTDSGWSTVFPTSSSSTFRSLR